MEELFKTAKELWNGEAPLRPTFWIYGFAVVLAFKWAMRAMAAAGYAATPIYVIIGAIAAAYSAFVAVSVWRSAAKFEGNKLWAHAARVGVITWPLSIYWGP